jgi:hypothetical protein
MVGLVAALTTMSALFLRKSPWQRLAAHYEAGDLPDQCTLWFRSATIDDVGYGFCLVLHAGRDGLGIRVLPGAWFGLPGLGHPHLLIPGSELRARRQRAFTETLELRTKALPDLSVWIRASQVERLAVASVVEVAELERRWPEL